MLSRDECTQYVWRNCILKPLMCMVMLIVAMVIHCKITSDCVSYKIPEALVQHEQYGKLMTTYKVQLDENMNDYCHMEKHANNDILTLQLTKYKGINTVSSDNFESWVKYFAKQVTVNDTQQRIITTNITNTLRHLTTQLTDVQSYSDMLIMNYNNLGQTYITSLFYTLDIDKNNKEQIKIFYYYLEYAYDSTKQDEKYVNVIGWLKYQTVREAITQIGIKVEIEQQEQQSNQDICREYNIPSDLLYDKKYGTLMQFHQGKLEVNKHDYCNVEVLNTQDIAKLSLTKDKGINKVLLVDFEDWLKLFVQQLT
eukprot:375921_1